MNFDFIRNFEQAPLGSLLRASKGMLGRFIKFVSHSSKRLQRKRICSNCFQDQGLKLDAELIGTVDNATCYNCKSRLGRKLSREAVLVLSHRFFVRGSIHRFEYGYAPAIAFNEQHATDISTPMWLTADVQLIENTVGIGFFHYGPRLWMIGENYPLQDLQDHGKRAAVIKRILAEYPDVMLTPDHIFYRIRRGPKIPEESSEYDSPPLSIAGAGRLDSEQFPVLYGSQDLQVCIHECRVTAEDEIFLATIRPTKPLRLLDLSKLLQEDGTEFESLDLAIHMLLLAGKHSYPISRDIALAVHAAGYDGLAYPSYFSLLRTGGMPLETTLGMSHRKLQGFASHEKSKIIANFGLFGRPIEGGTVRVQCINRLVLSRVQYELHFGPVGYQ